MRRRLVFGVLCLCLFGVIAAPAGAVGGADKGASSTTDFDRRHAAAPGSGTCTTTSASNGSMQMSIVLRTVATRITTFLTGSVALYAEAASTAGSRSTSSTRGSSTDAARGAENTLHRDQCRRHKTGAAFAERRSAGSFRSEAVRASTGLTAAALRSSRRTPPRRLLGRQRSRHRLRLTLTGTRILGVECFRRLAHRAARPRSRASVS